MDERLVCYGGQGMLKRFLDDGDIKIYFLTGMNSTELVRQPR